MKKILISLLLVFATACGSDDGKSVGESTQILPDGFEKVWTARLSNSGDRLAIIAERNEESFLITTSLIGTDIKEIAIDDLGYLSSLAWSADDNSIYVSADGIERVTISDGSTETIVDAFAVASLMFLPMKNGLHGKPTAQPI